MKTNVEVLEKQQRELTVCDSCGREVDDDGQTCECDFCSICAPSYTDPNVPDDVLTVEEWEREDDIGSSIRDDFVLAKWIMLLASVISVTGLLYSAAHADSGSPEESVMIGMAVILALVCLFGYGCLHSCRERCVETIKQRGEGNE